MSLLYEILPSNSQLRPGLVVTAEFAPAEVRWSSGLAERRRRALVGVERELHKGNYRKALTLVKHLQGKPGGLRGFGAAKQIPKRLASMDELEVKGRDLSYLRPLVDASLVSIQQCIEFASMEKELTHSAERIVLEEGSEPLSEEEYMMFAQHEAGHFLTGYFLGILPKEYKLLRKVVPGQNQFAGGRVNFVGFEFLREVPDARRLKQDREKGKLCHRASKGQVSSTDLNNFSCVILGGLVAEHLYSGYSEGLHSDVDKLYRVINWLGMTQTEADHHVKWAALNTAFLLYHHQETRSRLAEAMVSGKSITSCINTIEDSICGKEI